MKNRPSPLTNHQLPITNYQLQITNYHLRFYSSTTYSNSINATATKITSYTSSRLTHGLMSSQPAPTSTLPLACTAATNTGTATGKSRIGSITSRERLCTASEASSVPTAE